jgi:transposase, IS5 family
MKPRTPGVTPQDDLLRSRLENLISPKHPLVRLGERIDWDVLNERLEAHYGGAAMGQPPKRCG